LQGGIIMPRTREEAQEQKTEQTEEPKQEGQKCPNCNVVELKATKTLVRFGCDNCGYYEVRVAGLDKKK